MPWNGSGVFARVYSWVADAAAGLDILADRMDQDTDDLAQGLMHCLTVNGETVPTANLPMANYRHTGVSAGVADTDYCTVGQLKNGGGGLGPGGFLQLSGGTMTGRLIMQSGDNPNITLRNTGAGPVWAVWAGGNPANLVFGISNAAGVPQTSVAHFTQSGDLVCGTGDITAVNLTGTNDVTAFNVLGSNGNLSVLGNGGFGGNLSVTGTATINGNLVSNHNITGQQVTGQTGLGTSGNLSVGGTAGIGGALTVNGLLTCVNQVSFLQTIYPATNNTSECGIAASAWFGVESYAFVQHSDRRSKTDLAPLDADCLDLVRRIAPQRFRWVEGRDKGQHWGFVAQDVAAAMAAAGHEFGGHLADPESGAERLAYNELVAVLWRAVAQLAQRLDAMSTPATEPPAGLPA